MLQRTKPLWLSLHHRRKWETRIASVLSEKAETEVDTAAKRFEKIYKEKKFTPIEKAFPLEDSSRWSDLAPITPAPHTEEPKTVNPHSCQVSFLGPQNSGKSSLINAMSHAHISTESCRSGSTRECVTAVSTVHNTQLMLVDTPGIVQVKGPKDRRRHADAALKAWDSLFTAEVVCLTLPAGLGFVEPEAKSIAKEVVRRAAQRDLPVVLAVTKMDKVQTSRQREMYFAMRTDLETLNLCFAQCIETSVKDSQGLVELKDFLCRYAVRRPWKYYRHESTSLTPSQRVSELLRQVFMETLPHEVPHHMRHRLIGWTRKDNGATEVVVEVYFGRPSYLFTFYSKLEGIGQASQALAERELKAKYFFVFQGFLTPGNISSSSR